MSDSDSLFEQIRELRGRLRDEMRARHQRSLPLNEELSDRWERARYLGFGEGASIYDSTLVFGDVVVGPQTWIGPFVVLDGSGGLTIGSYCSISAGVHIYSHDTVEWALTAGRAEYVRRPTAIGSACYIGPHAVIAAGVTIGDHSIVGCNSFVNRDVPAFTMVAGNPATVKGRVVVEGARARVERGDRIGEGS
jgi:acetyltransferase-like isoleucine patch superfamily enzyme